MEYSSRFWAWWNGTTDFTDFHGEDLRILVWIVGIKDGFLR